MRETLLIVALAGACGGLLMMSEARSAETGGVIGPEAVWQPGMGFMQTVREQCDKGDPGHYGECLIAQMPAAGAPSPAVAFSRRLQASSNGQIGYARDFREAGRVDIAYVDYPLRANENQGWLLVNGEPSLIDVDDLARLPRDVLQRDRGYTALAERYPRVTLFPGDRAGTRYPAAQALPNGGQRFVVRYRLQDGCHACQRLGSASFGFDFDPTGRFVGAKFLKVQAAKQADGPALSKPAAAYTDPVTAITARPGQAFLVRLESNRSTGYAWQLAQPLDRAIVKLTDHKYEPPGNARPGAGGSDLWRFVAVAEGSTTLAFAYARPWEKDSAPARSLEFRVAVHSTSRPP